MPTVELIAVLPDTDERGVQQAAESLRAAVESLGLPHQGSLARDRVTVTVGYTCLPTVTEWTATAAMEVAHVALRRAKSGGHNRVDGEDIVPSSPRITSIDPVVAIATAPTQVFARS